MLGHSLGGALANLFTAAILVPVPLNGNPDVATARFGALYTFGQPRVGGYKYVKNLEDALAASAAAQCPTNGHGNHGANGRNNHHGVNGGGRGAPTHAPGAAAMVSEQKSDLGAVVNDLRCGWTCTSAFQPAVGTQAHGLHGCASKCFQAA